MNAWRLPEMVEPKGDERRACLQICRANARLHILTGEPLSDEDSQTQWENLRHKDKIPYAKWLWMWNYGKAEWDPRHGDSAGGE